MGHSIVSINNYKLAIGKRINLKREAYSCLKEIPDFVCRLCKG